MAFFSTRTHPGVRQEQADRRLVGDEGLHMARVVSRQRKSRDGATAAAEHMGGPLANCLEHPSHVVGQQCWIGILAWVLDRAALEAAGVVGHEGVVLSEQ